MRGCIQLPSPSQFPLTSTSTKCLATARDDFRDRESPLSGALRTSSGCGYQLSTECSLREQGSNFFRECENATRDAKPAAWPASARWPLAAITPAISYPPRRGFSVLSPKHTGSKALEAQMISTDILWWNESSPLDLTLPAGPSRSHIELSQIQVGINAGYQWVSAHAVAVYTLVPAVPRKTILLRNYIFPSAPPGPTL
jgi:hypothetical protein